MTGPSYGHPSRPVRRILGWWGCHQASTMTMDERARVLEITRDTTKGKIPIVVGTGTINPNSVVKMTQQAKEYGADARWAVPVWAWGASWVAAT